MMIEHVAQILCALPFCALEMAGQSCQPLESARTPQFESFLQQWYKLSPQQSFTLIDSGTVDSACYRKLVFRASMPAPLLTLYLTPDGKHLVSGLMDLKVDPAVARRKKEEEVEALLENGALLTSGESAAPLKMVVFTDFQCPYCKRFAGFLSELTPGERSKLQLTYRQFPLNMHSWAQDAAALAACVAMQDRAAFWKLHNFLFSEQQELSKETLASKAMDFLSHDKTFDTKQVASCLTGKAFQEFLQRDERLAMDLGINATPTVFLNGQKIRAGSLQDLRTAMHAAGEELVPATPEQEK